MDTDALVVIRKATAEDWDGAMELAFRVFLKYEAEEYGAEGLRNFAQFITDEDLKKMFCWENICCLWQKLTTN